MEAVSCVGGGEGVSGTSKKIWEETKRNEKRCINKGNVRREVVAVCKFHAVQAMGKRTTTSNANVHDGYVGGGGHRGVSGGGERKKRNGRADGTAWE